MNFGDVVTVDVGTPIGSEAGSTPPAIVATADACLRFRPSTVFAVPLATTPRVFPSHVAVVEVARVCLFGGAVAAVVIVGALMVRSRTHART